MKRLRVFLLRKSVIIFFFFFKLMSNREDELYRLSSAVQARYMAPLLSSAAAFAQVCGDMSPDERTQLALAFNLVLERPIYSIEALSSKADDDAFTVASMRTHVKSSLLKICNEIRRVISMELLPNSLSFENKCFWELYEANLIRVLYVHCREANVETVTRRYAACYKHCTVCLPPFSLTRLGAAVNYATFLADECGVEKSSAFASQVISELHAEVSATPSEDVKMMVRLLSAMAK